jgi:hypothetical protein
MIQWMELRHGRLWFARASCAVLGASALLVSGCSTTTVADKSGSKSSQVAGRGKSASASKADKSKSAKEIAKSAPGKTRLSDLDDKSRDRMVAQVAARNAPPTPNPTTAPPVTAAAPAAMVAQQSAPRRPARDFGGPPVITPGAAGNPSAAMAQTQRRGAEPATSRQRQGNVVAADSRADSGTIAQASGSARPSYPVAGRRPKSAGQNKPAVSSKKTQWQPENGGDATLASSHDRARADVLMQRAHHMLENGYREEALRLASIAADLETAQQAIYRRGEERPTEFIAKLRRSDASQMAASSVTRPPEASAAIVAAPVAEGQSSVISARRSAFDFARRSPGWTAPLDFSAPDARRTSASANERTTAAVAQPRFTTDDRDNLRIAANAGQVEVPVPPPPRSPNTEGSSADLEIAAIKAGSLPGIVTADRAEDVEVAPKKLAASAKAPKPAPAAPDIDPAEEIDPVADPDASPSESTPTSQLTIASLVGLLTGVAGMFGLGWWRRQEQRHYAVAQKAPDLRIQEREEKPAEVRRAA